jgi:hypothetical protein
LGLGWFVSSVKKGVALCICIPGGPPARISRTSSSSACSFKSLVCLSYVYGDIAARDKGWLLKEEPLHLRVCILDQAQEGICGLRTGSRTLCRSGPCERNNSRCRAAPLSPNWGVGSKKGDSEQMLVFHCVAAFRMVLLYLPGSAFSDPPLEMR